jgi:hypothetical protein
MSQLRTDYPNIAREIKEFHNVENKRQCTLHNGSTIKVVACRDSGKGERATFIIGEEFRIMVKSRYDEIVRPFAYARQTPYLKIPEFNYKKNPDNKNLKYLIEEPREVLISSAYYKGEWWYAETLAKIKMMLRGESAGFIAFDYLIAIEHNIKTENLIQRERETMDEITFQQEYENIPFGENENSYFKLDMFKNIRVIKKAFYPLRKDEIVGLKKINPHDIKRIDGEIRVISVDCSSRKNKNNDNTIITCIRLLPTNKGYIREFCYMESHQGVTNSYKINYKEL